MLLLSDYDGTLTPIVGRPEQAVLAPGVRAILIALAARPGFTGAIVSGRSLEDVRTRVNVDGLIYSGNHGLEIAGPGLQFVEAQAAAAALSLGALCERIVKAAGTIPGLIVENKRLTASVHFRQVPAEFLEELGRIVGSIVEPESERFLVRQGQAVFEIRPRVAWHKGEAAVWIRDHWAADAEATLVLGDDQTDEDMFTKMMDATTVRVGECTETAARFVLRSPTEVAELLARLLE